MNVLKLMKTNVKVINEYCLKKHAHNVIKEEDKGMYYV